MSYYDYEIPFELPEQQRAALRTYNVYTAKNKRPRKVVATYHRIEDGALVFRIPNPTGYPFMVATFAPGMWLEVR